MTPQDLRRILSNVVGEKPQIYFSIYDPTTGFLGGPWEVVTVLESDAGMPLVVLVKLVGVTKRVADAINDLSRILLALPGPVAGPIRAGIQFILERIARGL